MTTPYQRGFRKIAELSDLPQGEPRLYRTGGATILLLRSRFGVRAVDAAACVTDDEPPGDWSVALGSSPIPAEIHDGAVWVCVDLCTRE